MPNNHQDTQDLYKKVLIHKQALLRENYLLQIKLEDALFEIRRLKTAMKKGAAFLASEVDR